ncbi:hypothetical protein [Rheinheimera faecalis]|uniref:hypothetical protein n=1 Tax=Rheinheimera faecalis TaxID=2901141 RepID=UPI001E2D9120|nr:hypothetical protein [Rheinheimera faecalis]
MKTIYVSVAALVLSGCASVMTSEEQSINITSSNNKPIEVSVDDKKATTPGTVVVLRDGKDKVVTSTTPGCQNATPIKKDIATPFWGNILIGGVFGSTTDASTGKMWNYADTVEISCTEQ